MSDPVGSGPHAGHDPDLMAAAAAGDLSEAEQARAEAVVRSCADCRAILTDLQLITAATRSLGSAFDGRAAPAPRDYRVTESEAARLTRGRISVSGFRVRRRIWFHRLGSGLVALGIAALLISAAPLSFLGGSGAASPGAQSERLNAAPASAAPAAPQALPDPSSGGAAKAMVTPAPALDFAATPTSPADGGSISLAIAGATGLLIGIVLLLAARTPRRTGP